MSHLITQTLRYSLTGTLPLPTGAMRPGTEVENKDIWSLAGLLSGDLAASREAVAWSTC